MNAPDRPAVRGRPRAFDAERGVAAARELFGARGYAAVGVGDVCEAVGIRPPSFYAAWGNKLGLFERVVESYAADLGRRFARAMRDAHDPVDVRRRVLRAAARAYGAASAGCLVLENDRLDDAAVRGVTGARVEATLAALEARLGELGCDAPREEARAILLVMRGLSASAHAGASTGALLRSLGRLDGLRGP